MSAQLGQPAETSHPAPWTVKHCPDEGCERYVIEDHLGNGVTDDCVEYDVAARCANAINGLHRDEQQGVA